MALIDRAYYMHHYAPAAARQTMLATAARLRQFPGVNGVTLATIPPLRRAWIEHVNRHRLYLNAVDPSCFGLMGVKVLQGRIFGPGDGAAAVVVSESAARSLWPNESPLAKTCRIQGRDRTVIGVVRDSGVNLATNPDSVEVYTPIGPPRSEHRCRASAALGVRADARRPERGSLEAERITRHPRVHARSRQLP